jgi:hypothetical protein
MVCTPGECTGTAAMKLVDETTEYSLGSNMSMSMDLVTDAEFGLYETIAEEDILDTGLMSMLAPSSDTPTDLLGVPTYSPSSSPPPLSAPSYYMKKGFIAAIEEGTNRSSGFTARHSFQIRKEFTFMGVLVATLFIPGRKGAGQSLLSISKGGCRLLSLPKSR